MTEQSTPQAALTGYASNERDVAEGLFREGYQVLLTLARSRRRGARFSDTMQTSDVLHESFLKLSGKHVWQSQEHFMRTASLAMRQVIVDHARARLTDKRGGGQPTASLEEAEQFNAEFSETPEQIIAIADLLERLEQENPRWMRIVDARYFAGMTEDETAEALGLSPRTVRRDWRAARDWLANALGIAE